MYPYLMAVSISHVEPDLRVYEKHFYLYSEHFWTQLHLGQWVLHGGLAEVLLMLYGKKYNALGRTENKREVVYW